MLRLHVEDQVPLAALARSTGIGERTLQRWHQRYRVGGIPALEPRPRADAGQRHTSADLVLFIERLALTRPRPSIATLHWSVPEKMEAWFSCREFVDVSVS